MKALDFKWAEEILLAVMVAFGVDVLLAVQGTDWLGALTDLRHLGLSLAAGALRQCVLVGVSLLLARRPQEVA